MQSNVTGRIRALEDEVGLPLFDRHSRGMALTEAGRRLLPYAERVLALMKEAKVAARDGDAGTRRAADRRDGDDRRRQAARPAGGLSPGPSADPAEPAHRPDRAI